ncbi:MAG: PQQ-like beta-propeller repeat protein [Verrucomicrobiales bacterium]|nr:PQQ-like beta-propeller repeat protein [Verrucomicrobiales bacterium]
MSLLALTLTFKLAGLVTAAPAPAGDWPQWRGPLGTGVAPEATPPLTWSESKNVRWKTSIPGFGTSTPILVKDTVYLLTAVNTAGDTKTPLPAPAGSPPPAPGNAPRSEAPTAPYAFQVIALSRSTGAISWTRTLTEEIPHEGHHRDHGFASSSPVTDGETLVASFGSRGVYALDLSGGVKWKVRLGQMRTRNNFGEGASPALHGQTVVVPWDHEGEDFVVALHRDTGRELWRQQRDEPTTWSTPLIIDRPGRTEVVLTAPNRIRSYDLATGKPLWECAGLFPNVVASPVVSLDTFYAVCGHRGNALLAIRLGGSGDLTGTEAIRWRHDRGTPYVPSPILLEDTLYFVAGNNATLSRLDARSGRPDFEAARIEGVFGVYASPITAAGRVYLVGRDGKTAVIRHAPQLEILSVNALEDRFDASPAAVGKDLLLRGHRALYCLSGE